MHEFILRGRHGFTLIELLVVIAIIATLAAIIFPVFSKAREKGRQTQCISNQHQISLAIIMYADDIERYPGIDWYSKVEGIRGVLKCPNQPNLDVSIAMNGYLHFCNPAAVTRPSNVICTVDSQYSSALSAEAKRHGRGAIYSRLDGSAVWVSDKTPEKAGRFIVGKFPIVPITVQDGEQMLIPPDSFIMVEANKDVTKQFLLAGPYGNNTSTARGDTANDYIGEELLSGAFADDSPCAGVAVPEVDMIFPPITGVDIKVNSSYDFNKYTVWTVPAALGGVWASSGSGLSDKLNYNCKYYGRTTYAATYIYSETPQTVNIMWWCDDMGKIWLNGNLIATRNTFIFLSPEPNDAHDSRPINNVQIPRGISYMLIKTVNGSSVDAAAAGKAAGYYGGMKFKLRFDKALYFSATL